jgi:hypothetical protein
MPNVPMRRRLTSIENAEVRQDQSADANRTEPAWTVDILGEARAHR